MSYQGRRPTPSIASALTTAMSYPFRPGVAKVLVVAPASGCSLGWWDSSIVATLQARGFQVHILQEQGFHRDDVPDDFLVYGLDNSKTFTNDISDSDLTPRDVHRTVDEQSCSYIAAATQGSVFDTVHLQARKEVQDKFIQAFAHRVGWDTKLPACQSCPCGPQSAHTCTVCHTSMFNYLPSVFNLPNTIASLSYAKNEIKQYVMLD